jgi:molecular chaperone HtpG
LPKILRLLRRIQNRELQTNTQVHADSIKFGTKKKHSFETRKIKAEDFVAEEVEVDNNIINNPNPAWTKQPTELTDEDYKNFYHELYPMQFEEPLFNIHLNVDYPFNLTGILYFKMSNDMQLQKDKNPNVSKIRLLY